MKNKIQIKSRYSGRILFEYEKEGNTVYSTIMQAVGSDVNLYGADLRGVNLYGADLSGANLGKADLSEARLCDALMRGANLFGANLRGADLSRADLLGANLFGADLRLAKGLPYIPLACPSEGAFIGWKKVNGCLVQLLIPEDAKRCSATTRKCRCEFAKVLSITRGGEKKLDRIYNETYFPTIEYRVGEIVKPDSFDEDRWNECSHGIHFFINKQDAIDY